MKKFRKKPVVVYAEQFDGTDEEARRLRLVCRGTTETHDNIFVLQSQTGVLRVLPGDWIVTGTSGERYPCKNDIFRAAYEPVDGQQWEWAEEGSDP